MAVDPSSAAADSFWSRVAAGGCSRPVGKSVPGPRGVSREQIADALREGTDLPKHIQLGPTCGLHALSMVMDYYHQLDETNARPAVGDGPPGNRSPGGLFEEAKAAGFTTMGEMFYADQLAALARRFGYEAEVKPLDPEALQACLDRKHPPIVPIDVDFNGELGLFNGMRAHWCVIEGRVPGAEPRILVATHSYPNFSSDALPGMEHVWFQDALLESSSQLRVSDFPGAPADIHPTLASKLVEVWPGSSR